MEGLSEAQISSIKQTTHISSRSKIIALYNYFSSLPSPLTAAEFAEIKYLCHNPFKHEISNAFSRNNGTIAFDDFVDFFSVFGKSCALDVKAVFAFKIYGLVPGLLTL